MTRLKYLSNKAVAKHKEGQKEEAISLYLKSLELDKNQPAWIYGNVITLLAEVGQIEQGLKLQEQALKIYPNSDEIYRAIGLALNKQGDIDKSVEYYLKALDIDKDQPDWLYSYLIENFVLQNQFDRAIDIGAKGVLVHPDCHWINYHLGNSFAALKQWGNAHDAYKKALAKKKSLPGLQEKIDFVLKRNLLKIRKKNVTKYLEKIKCNSKDIDAHYKLLYEDYKTVLLLLNLAFNLAENNNLNNAIQYYKQAIALNSSLVDFYLNNQEVFGEKFKFQKTIVRLHEEVKLLPEKSISQKPNLNNFLLNKYQKLLSIYNQALEFYPNEVEIYLEIANIYAQQNRLIKAISFCKRAFNIEPQNINIELILTQIQNIQKNFYASVQNISGISLNYSSWLKKNLLQHSDIDWIPEIVDTFGYKPLISIIVLVENIPESYLVEMLESVLLQIYPYWELCLADNASVQPCVREILKDYAAKDIRIKLILREQQENTAVISNSALELATGDFVALLRQEDLLTPNALYEVAELLNRHPEADMVYSDEDKVNQEGKFFAPYFKPNWCPDSFLSRMYTCNLGVYRYSIIQDIGSFRAGYDEASIYDLILRFTEKTTKIFHIPKILYHRRMTSTNSISESRQLDYTKSNKQAIQDALKRRNESGEVIENNEVPGIYTVRYQISEHKLVSIIIPTKNRGKILHQCLQSIFEKSTYPNYEVIIIDNGTEEENTLEILRKWQENEPNRCFCHRLDIPFNYSKLNNFGVSKAKGDYLLFLNNDTEVITEDWIEGMVEQAQRNSIGAVGAMLIYLDNKIQHGGVILGIRGVASHSHKNYSYGDTGYANQLISTNNYSAVTAACLMCRREVFKKVNGFDEILQVAFNDVDFCLKIKNQGYNNVWLPHVVLYHHESQSRGYDDTLEKQERFRQEVAEMETRWGKLIAQDPCYNINLSKTREDYSLSEC